MDLLISLGVNSTLPFQFAQFVIVYLILRYYLFNPYFAAYNARSERTVGKTELAERFVAEARELEDQFTRKAQEVNEQYKAVYDRTRSEALHEYDTLVEEGRGRAKAVVDESRKRIQMEMQTARAQIEPEVGSVAKLISQKLIGKDFSA